MPAEYPTPSQVIASTKYVFLEQPAQGFIIKLYLFPFPWRGVVKYGFQVLCSFIFRVPFFLGPFSQIKLTVFIP